VHFNLSQESPLAVNLSWQHSHIVPLTWWQHRSDATWLAYRHADIKTCRQMAFDQLCY